MEGQDFLSNLFHLEYNNLLAYARKILSLHGVLTGEEDAEDAVQETFLLAWRNLPQLQNSKNPGGWLMQTQKNVLNHTLRSDRRAVKRLAAACAALDPDGHVPAPGADLELEGFTSPENLLLLREFYLDGESYDTLCLKYGLKKSGLAKRLKNAREEFKKNYGEGDLFAESGNVSSEGGAEHEG